MILESVADDALPGQPNFSFDAAVVSELQYTTNEITLAADIPQDGFLVVSTNYHPDWQVTIEQGDSSKVISPRRANYSLMAINVRAGQQSIRFSFRPASQELALAVSVVTWVCLLLVSFVYATRWVIGRRIRSR